MSGKFKSVPTSAFQESHVAATITGCFVRDCQCVNPLRRLLLHDIGKYIDYAKAKVSHRILTTCVTNSLFCCFLQVVVVNTM